MTNLSSPKLSHLLGARAQGIQAGERGTGSSSPGEHLGRGIHGQPHGHHPPSIPCWISSVEASPAQHSSEAELGGEQGRTELGGCQLRGAQLLWVNQRGTGRVGSALLLAVTRARQLPAKTGRAAVVTMTGNLTTCCQESRAVSSGIRSGGLWKVEYGQNWWCLIVNCAEQKEGRWMQHVHISVKHLTTVPALAAKLTQSSSVVNTGIWTKPRQPRNGTQPGWLPGAAPATRPETFQNWASCEQRKAPLG